MITLSKDMYNYVSKNIIDQTSLVEKLLQDGIFSWEDILNNNEDEDGNYNDIYSWYLFGNFNDTDYDKLEDAGILVLRNEYGNWVGITAYGSDFNDWLFPILINALFDLNIGHMELIALQKGM